MAKITLCYRFSEESRPEEIETNIGGFTIRYKVTPTLDDYSDYLFTSKEKEEEFEGYDNANSVRVGASIAIEKILSKFTWIKEALDSDPCFIAFLTKRYEDEAIEKFFGGLKKWNR